MSSRLLSFRREYGSLHLSTSGIVYANFAYNPVARKHRIFRVP